MKQAVRERFERSFRLYTDLIGSVGEDVLRARLGELPSNTVGEQLWCVVGARESYGRAITAGRWSGFTCSLADPHDLEQVAQALARSADLTREALDVIDSADAARSGLVIDLLEHEAAHQGQLIRYLYGLRLRIPDSWKKRYALE